MRKYFAIAALVVAAAVSCTKEIGTEVVVTPKVGYVELTLTARTNADSKASLDGKNVVWEVGENVAVFTSASEAPEQFTVKEVNGTDVTITGMVPGEASTFIAAYPYENAVSCTGGVVKMVVPSEQFAETGNVDGSALNSVAYFESAGSVPVFKNAVSLVKFSLGEEGVTSVSLAPVTSGAFAGEVEVVAETAAVSGGDGAVTVTCSAGFTKNEVYYAAVAPGAFEGLKASVLKDNGRRGIRTSTTGTTVERNAVLDLGKVDSGIEAWKFGVITTGQQLADFLAEANTYTSEDEVELGSDIDLSGISLVAAESFAGTFDGRGFSLKNWTSDGVALFAKNEGTVKDFTLDSSCQLSLPAEITNFAFVVVNNLGTVSDIINNADVTGTDVDFKGGRLGVIVGVSTSPSSSVALTIENCVNNGDVTITTAANTTGTQYVGTVVGSLGGSTLNNLSDCVNNGALSITCSDTNTKNFYIGGVAGGTTNGSNNIRVKNTGDVSFICAGHEAALCLSGVTSYTTGVITDCENTGKITFQSDASLKATFVSGIAGYFASNTMSGSVNRGDVTVVAARINGRNGIGDINSNVYNGTNAITAGLTVGGLVSATGKNPVFVDSENYGDVSLTLNNPSNTDGTHTAARPSVGGLVGDCSGPMTGCNNYGKVSVVLGSGTPFTPKNAGYTFYIGGIVGSSYNFCGASTSGGSDTNKFNKFKLENCNNSGDLYYKTDNTHTTNNTVAGICGWPGSEDSTTPYIAKNCNNSGNVTYEGAGIKIRAGGIHGGTGRMDGCHNTGKITVISADPGSVAGSIAGFHSQAHTFSNCVAEGSVEAQCTINGMGGLVGNLGNVTITGMDGCSVNCDLIGGPDGKTGLVVGYFNGTSKNITLGSTEDPIEVAGTVNGVAIDATNCNDLISGSTNRTEGVHVIYTDIQAAPKQPALERVWGWYSEGSNLWTGNVSAISVTHPDGYGMVRGIAMDDEYVYLPKSSAYAAICAVKITDPTVQVKGNVSGVTVGSAFQTSFVRMIKNTDPSVNGGKDVLLLSNLSETNVANLVIYAYTDGITNPPVILAQFAWDSANNTQDWRRYGDRFFVTGTWQDGKIYLPAYSGNKIVVLSVANGTRTAVTQLAAGSNSPEGFKDLSIYPGGNMLFITSASVANQVSATGGLSQGWNEYALNASSVNGKGTFGYNFFEFNGKKYMAYARVSSTTGQLEVIEDQGSEDTFLASIDAQDGILKAPIHSADNLEASHATGGLGDCCVREIDGQIYIASLTRDGGLVVDKLILE